jgi:CheY-like chemotaxis protein
MYCEMGTPLRLRPLNILLVEDDEATLLLMEDLILRSSLTLGQPHKIFKAFEAEEGLNIIKDNEDIDLVFLDYHLPKMNGNVFCKVLRSSRQFSKKPSLWIVAHTREQRQDLIEDILESGANDYMLKPIVPNRFLLGFRVAQYGIARIEHLYRRLEVKQKIIESVG